MPRSSVRPRRLVFVVAPLLLLGLDFLSLPSFFQNRAAVQSANLARLLYANRVLLGIVERHRIYASIDDIASADYLSDMASMRNGVVISGFTSSQPEDEPYLARLGDAVLVRLEKLSRSDYNALRNALSRARGIRGGDIVTVDLHLSDHARASFPVDVLYIVIFEENFPIDSKQLKSGLAKAASLGAKQRIDNLIIPCLGRTWEHGEDTDALDFREIFSASFSAAKAESSLPAIYLSLYKQWPTFELEEAVGALNAEWANFAFPDSPPSHVLIYRGALRATLILWTLCLLASSFFAAPTVKNFLIISAGYLGLALGCDQVVGFLIQGRPLAGLLFHSVVLLVLAIGFPFFVSWNPKDVFHPTKGAKKE